MTRPTVVSGFVNVCEHCSRSLNRDRQRIDVVHRRSGERRTLVLCAGCASKDGATWRLRYEPVRLADRSVDVEPPERDGGARRRRTVDRAAALEQLHREPEDDQPSWRPAAAMGAEDE